jgi:hypothetical protein
MESIFITYTNIPKSMRNIELLSVIEDVSNDNLVISPWDIPVHSSSKNIKTKQGFFKYLFFIISAIKTIKKYNPKWIVLNNNQTAILVKYIKKNFPDTIVVYDSAELYINVKTKTIKEKLSFFMRSYEKKYLHMADLVFAANQERADIMKDYFALSETPFVFDNIHPIKNDINLSFIKEEIKSKFPTNKFTILYSGGISKQRKTMDIVMAVTQLDHTYRLLIVGSVDKNEFKIYNEYIQTNSITNIHYLGYATLSELRYLYMKSDVSISIYGMDTLNNKFCASGKVYESLFEYTPIVTSENPPLYNLCRDYGVGVSSNDLYGALQKVRLEYSYFRKKTEEFVLKFNEKKRYDDIVNQISEIVNKRGLK